MAFHPGETVICKLEVRDTETEELVDPSTSTTITITDNQNGIEVDGEDMVNDSTGKYHYDWNTTTDNLDGIYKIIYIATDSTRVSMHISKVELIHEAPIASE